MARAAALSFLVLFGFTLGTSSADAPPATTPVIKSIVRFSQVDERLYRGGQPDKAGFEALRRLGIQTIVNLRAEDTTERAVVEGLGMKFVHLPVTMSPFGASGPIPTEYFTRFLETVSDPANGRVFVHCRHGKDRTGLFVSLYRVVQQGWSVNRAFREARDIGLAWWHSGARQQLESLSAMYGSGHGPGAPALPASNADSRNLPR